MKNQLELFEERINHISDILGDLSIESLNSIPIKRLTSNQEKLKTLTDAINFLQKELKEIDSIHTPEILKKFEKIYPLLDEENFREDSILTDKEKYFLIMSNFDELENFLKNINYIKKNQKSLEVNLMIEGDKKIKEIRPLELKGMELESKASKMTENIENLVKNYTETIEVINKKFKLYNDLLNNNEIDQKREKKSNFRIKSASNQYQPHQTNNFRDIYINQSPTYFNQYRYPKENQSNEIISK